jgi:glycosyltransferase involved in cell wall biosynthesis
MKKHHRGLPVTIFTPSSAAENNTNAQNLTVKEIVARLPPELFRVTMLCEHTPDPRIATRGNTNLVPYMKHGNTIRLLKHCLFPSPDIYFFPRSGPLDRAFFDLRKYLPINTALITYIVMLMNEVTGAGLVSRSVMEADLVCTNSKYVSDTVRERFGVEPITVYDGADHRFFFPCREGQTALSSTVTVLYAGSFQPRKRVELVIEQAARWPTVQFRLAGRGVTEDGCKALTERLGCKNVFFLGHLDPARLGEEMRGADVFLFPSILEGHPQVLVQAAASGLPVVAMNLYRPDYVINGLSGFLVESDAELGARLDSLLGNPALRQSMATAAVQHSHGFDWDHIARQWAGIFQEVAARREA